MRVTTFKVGNSIKTNQHQALKVDKHTKTHNKISNALGEVHHSNRNHSLVLQNKWRQRISLHLNLRHSQNRNSSHKSHQGQEVHWQDSETNPHLTTRRTLFPPLDNLFLLMSRLRRWNDAVAPCPAT